MILEALSHIGGIAFLIVCLIAAFLFLSIKGPEL
jgi:hypothetical protein